MLALSLALTPLVVSCDEEQPPVDQLPGAIHLDCLDQGVSALPDDDVRLVGTADFTTVTNCLFGRVSRTLTVTVVGPGNSELAIEVAGFSGAGAYVTTATADTVVSMTSETSDAYGSSNATESSPAHACTITVPRTDVDTTSAATGYLDVEVDCPVIGRGAIGTMECTVSPSTFTFVIAACDVTNT
jgi:hypothetical protein